MPSTASFDTDENARWQIAFLVDRLSARFGEHRVQRFVPQDTHIPEAARRGGAGAGSRFRQASWTRKRRDSDPPRRPLRLLAKPEEIERAFAGGARWPARCAFAGGSAAIRGRARRRAGTHRHGMVEETRDA